MCHLGVLILSLIVVIVHLMAWPTIVRLGLSKDGLSVSSFDAIVLVRIVSISRLTSRSILILFLTVAAAA
jgi:hypothetical protein